MLLWRAADNGATIGQTGSENGVIILDEEYNNQCRITLEKNGYIAPYCITCGVYGLMVHTVFAGDKESAVQKYYEMKNELRAFLDSDDIDSIDWCESFSSKWQ